MVHLYFKSNSLSIFNIDNQNLKKILMIKKKYLGVFLSNVLTKQGFKLYLTNLTHEKKTLYKKIKDRTIDVYIDIYLFSG